MAHPFPTLAFVLFTLTLSAHAESLPCSAESLLAERAGFGAETRGGDPSQVFHVTTLADSGPGSLREGLSSDKSQWIVFDVSGTVELKKKIRIKSDKTVDGRSSDISIIGSLTIDSGVKNVIVTDLTLSDPLEGEAGGDVIGIRGHAGKTFKDYDTHDLWFHHLDVSHGTDGLIDNRGGTNITISWSHFHHHAKAMLDDNDTDGANTPEMRMTYHHNFFEEITRRSPQLSFGKGDYYNNYNYHWYEFAAASRHGAQLLSENNIYEARTGTVCLWPCPDPNSPTHDSDFWVSKKALVNDWDTTETGNIRSTGDWLENGAKVDELHPDQVFRRKDFYSAQPETADSGLKSRIVAATGPRKTSCQ